MTRPISGLAVLAALLAACLCWSARAFAAAPEGGRVALVVGNAAYQHVPALANPDNDARSIAATLAALGFTLIGGGPQLDLDKPALEVAIRHFGEALKSGDVGLFYYAGHGVQVRGVNYLVPVGANPTREADIDFELVDANLVLRQMEGANTKLNIMILDACRNNPFGGRGMARAVTSGLAQMQAPEGTIISYATQPGNVAEDGNNGHSPFARAIATTLAAPGLPVLEAFNRIGVAVKHDTGGRQQPWVSNSPIDGDFSFVPGPPGAQPTATSLPAAVAPDAEVAFWQSIAHSSNPADFQAYLQTYPHGRFAALARLRIGAPAPATTAAAPPPPPSPPQLAPNPAPQVAMLAPLPPARSPDADPDPPLRYLVGRWRFPDARACGQRFGTITVAAGLIRFEWRLPGGGRNVAVERIERIDGNVVTTTVLSDIGSPNSEQGQQVRYVVWPDRWTSENLVTHDRGLHVRC